MHVELRNCLKREQADEQAKEKTAAAALMDQEDNGNGTEEIAVTEAMVPAALMDMKQCGYCGASLPKIFLGIRRKKCAGCKAVRYCNAACQMEHWPWHQRHCLKNKRFKLQQE